MEPQIHFILRYYQLTLIMIQGVPQVRDQKSTAILFE